MGIQGDAKKNYRYIISRFSNVVFSSLPSLFSLLLPLNTQHSQIFMIGKRLEQYTIKHPQQVLLVTVEINDEEDQIAIFKGFSSSLVRPTNFDPDVPVLPDDAKVLSIDIVASPYNPDAPRYLEQNLSWDIMQVRLSNLGM
ncbi:hypothetical protein NIES4101_74610 [Calothrix sp. NIES-4101]|nr:hypothetical protein NIES4101_74610 [Calothrix sp. NIES-4101]